MGILTEKVGEGLTALSAKLEEGAGNFIIFVTSKGIEAFMDIMAKSAAKEPGTAHSQNQEHMELPAEFQSFVDEIEARQASRCITGRTRAGNAAVGGALEKMIDYLTPPVLWTEFCSGLCPSRS